MSSVLVTGGGGFVGRAVVRLLLERGDDVVVLDDWSNGSPDALPDDPHLEVVTGDIRDGGAITGILARSSAEIVVHLAAIHFIPYCNAHPDECWDVNVNGTRSVAQAVAASGVSRLVIASTAAVYGVTDEAITEDDPVAPTDVYGATKAADEAIVSWLAAESGTSVACARLFNVFGPGETNPHVIPEIIRQLAAGGPLRLGNLSARRDYVHVTDVAAALCGLALRRDPGVTTCNVGTGSAVSVQDVLDVLAHLGHPVEVVPDPDRMRPSDRPVLLADWTRAAGLMGWAPQVGLEEGLAQLLEASVASPR